VQAHDKHSAGYLPCACARHSVGSVSAMAWRTVNKWCTAESWALIRWHCRLASPPTLTPAALAIPTATAAACRAHHRPAPPLLPSLSPQRPSFLASAATRLAGRHGRSGRPPELARPRPLAPYCSLPACPGHPSIGCRLAVPPPATPRPALLRSAPLHRPVSSSAASAMSPPLQVRV
jgi:hypothetical protein